MLNKSREKLKILQAVDFSLHDRGICVLQQYNKHNYYYAYDIYAIFNNSTYTSCFMMTTENKRGHVLIPACVWYVTLVQTYASDEHIDIFNIINTVQTTSI